MIKWSEFHTGGNVRSIGIGYVRGETLILLAQQVIMYHLVFSL